MAEMGSSGTVTAVNTFGGSGRGDPSGYAAGLNLYEHAGNNPACYTDPDGHVWFVITGAIGAGMGAVIGGGVAWWHGDNIWVGVGKGPLLGGIAGVTGGLAG